jgi:predicted AAA+ superfamily ATPase
MTSHEEVYSDRYEQAEFAADLAQIYRGEGESEYRDPREFFRRTFLTEGLRRLLGDALRRLTDGATLHALSQMRECLEPPQADS